MSDVLLEIKGVDPDFIEELRRTAPDGVRVEHQRIAFFSAGAGGVDVAVIALAATYAGDVAVGLISAWIYDKWKQFSNEGRNNPRAEGKTISDISRDQLLAILTKNAQRHLEQRKEDRERENGTKDKS